MWAGRKLVVIGPLNVWEMYYRQYGLTETILGLESKLYLASEIANPA